MQANTAEYNAARLSGADRWVPACGGHEQVFMHNGTRYLYVYNFHTHTHAYLNVDTDMIESRTSFM